MSANDNEALPPPPRFSDRAAVAMSIIHMILDGGLREVPDRPGAESSRQMLEGAANDLERLACELRDAGL